MRISAKELTELLANAHSDANERAALRERILKLEYKLNEMYDVLTDLRVNQIMGTKDE